MSGELSLIFKHVALPQFSKGKILTPVCHSQGFIPCLVKKTWPTDKNVQYPIAGDPISSLRCMAKRFWIKSKRTVYHQSLWHFLFAFLK
jgi:hypothetical protein